MHPCKVIAVASQKGGVDKTATTAALGTGLARAGNKTLLIGLDAQSNLTMSLGYQTPDDLPFTIADIMGKVIEYVPVCPSEGILEHSSGVHLIPSSIQLSQPKCEIITVVTLVICRQSSGMSTKSRCFI